MYSRNSTVVKCFTYDTSYHFIEKAKTSSQFFTVILQKLMDPEENFEKTLDSKFNWTRNVTSRNFCRISRYESVTLELDLVVELGPGSQARALR